jgi:hypothetical protein
MGNYTISYYIKGLGEFAYVDSKTYPSVQYAIVRAIMHLNSHPELTGAAIVYQGKKVQKCVRTILFNNIDPNHK